MNPACYISLGSPFRKVIRILGMRILFPQDPIETKEADGPFKPELTYD